jgi:hypothetical protein
MGVYDSYFLLIIISFFALVHQSSTFFLKIIFKNPKNDSQKSNFENIDQTEEYSSDGSC